MLNEYQIKEIIYQKLVSLLCFYKKWTIISKFYCYWQKPSEFWSKLTKLLVSMWSLFTNRWSMQYTSNFCEETINFFLNIINLINVKEFKQRLISTIILLFMFSIFLFLGNPFITILFCFLYSFTLLEFENLSSTLNKKSQLL